MESTAIVTTMPARKIRCKAHCPMEHLGGFMRSRMPPSGMCSRRISPTDNGNRYRRRVKTQTKHNFKLVIIVHFY